MCIRDRLQPPGADLRPFPIDFCTVGLLQLDINPGTALLQLDEAGIYSLTVQLSADLLPHEACGKAQGCTPVSYTHLHG